MNTAIGIDGGGTSTRTVLSIDGYIKASCRTGASNIYAAGFENAVKAIIEGIDSCIREAGLNEKTPMSIHIGGAGMGSIQNKTKIKDLLSSFYPSSIINISDDIAVLTPELGGSRSGIILIAGTGAIAYGQNMSGMSIRSGGYGWRLDDEGSSFYIAKEAIKRTLKSCEQIDLKTSIDKVLCRHYGISSITEIIYYINDDERKKTDYSSFTPEVIKLAEKGDLLAEDIIRKAVDAQFNLIESITKRLSPPFDKTILLSGGLLLNEEYLSARLIEKLNTTFPEYTVKTADKDSAVRGALSMAEEYLKTQYSQT